MATDTSGTPSAGCHSDGEVPIRVYGCSRLGRQANPPEIRGPLGGLLRRR